MCHSQSPVLISGSFDGTVKLWEAQFSAAPSSVGAGVGISHRPCCELNDLEGSAVTRVDISASGIFAAGGTEDGMLAIWRIDRIESDSGLILTGACSYLSTITPSRR